MYCPSVKIWVPCAAMSCIAATVSSLVSPSPTSCPSWSGAQASSRRPAATTPETVRTAPLCAPGGRAADRFHVVIQHVRLGGHQSSERIPVSAKVRDQDFHSTPRHAFANPGNGARENFRAAVGLIVTIDGGHHRVAQAHALHGFSYAFGFVLLRRARAVFRWAPRKTRRPACKCCPKS